MMTGHPGVFAGGDMVPCRADRDGRRRPRQEGGAAHRRLAARRRLRAAPRSTSSPTFDKLNTWYYADAPKTVRPTLEMARRTRDLRRGACTGSTRPTRCTRRAAASSCGNCFECDNCYGVCPDNAVIKLGPGKRFEFNYDFCKGCGRVRRGVPMRRHQMVPEAI